MKRRFRIHLSTAVMMVILLGVLLGLNLDRRTRYTLGRRGFYSPSRTTYSGDSPAAYKTESRGWPFAVVLGVRAFDLESSKIPPGEVEVELKRRFDSGSVPLRDLELEQPVDYRALVGNVLLAFLLVGGAAYAMERRIRRRNLSKAEA